MRSQSSISGSEIPASAEHEARAARDLNGDEADYLPVLLDAMLLRRKFKDIYDLIEPGDRNPVLESKVRTALGTAAVRLGYDDESRSIIARCDQIDPSVVEPRIQLARFLSGTRPEEADSVIDEAIAANPKSAELLQVKGEMLWSRGDANGAVRLFGEALEIDPDYQLARLSRANVNVTRGDFAAADEDLDPILQATPNEFYGQLPARAWSTSSNGTTPRRIRYSITSPRPSRLPLWILCAGSDKICAWTICARRKYSG